jgi:hypothetical protein
MKDRCAELCEVILLTTSVPEPIWRWPRTLRSREPWRSQNAGASSRFLTLEDSITDTSATLLRDRLSVSAIMASDILPWTCEPTQSVRQPRPHLFPADELLFALCTLCFAIQNTFPRYRKVASISHSGKAGRVQTWFSVMTGNSIQRLFSMT